MGRGGEKERWVLGCRSFEWSLPLLELEWERVGVSGLGSYTKDSP